MAEWSELLVPLTPLMNHHLEVPKSCTPKNNPSRGWVSVSLETTWNNHGENLGILHDLRSPASFTKFDPTLGVHGTSVLATSDQSHALLQHSGWDQRGHPGRSSFHRTVRLAYQMSSLEKTPRWPRWSWWYHVNAACDIQKLTPATSYQWGIDWLGFVIHFSCQKTAVHPPWMPSSPSISRKNR